MAADLNARQWQAELEQLALDDEAQAVAQCSLFAQEIRLSQDPKFSTDGADVIWECARRWAVSGHLAAARGAAQALRANLADHSSPGVQSCVAAALSLLAELEVSGGQISTGLETYDEALSLATRSAELTSHGVTVALLLAKARILATQQRLDEATASLDEALSAISAARSGDATLLTRQAAEAVAANIDCLCALDRFAEVTNVGQQLRNALSDVHLGSEVEALNPVVASETLLAAALAEVINGDQCWQAFAGERTVSRSEAVERALSLYAVSEPWTGVGAAPEAAVAATGIVRSVADGYALLSDPRAPASQASLPRRVEPQRYSLLQQFEVDSWAARLGHPLSPDSYVTRPGTQQTASDSAEQHEQFTGPRYWGALVRSAVRCLCMLDIARILVESEHGREALRSEKLAILATSHLEVFVGWTDRLYAAGSDEGRIGVAVACRLVAEGLYVVTHALGEQVMQALPSETTIGSLLRETSGDAWLRDNGGWLPAWVDVAEA